MSSIEPGYLRYVVDALQKGEINPDNASSLPEGLNGLFEQRFNEKIPSDQRLNKLKILLCWSIVKAPMTSGSFARLFAYPHREASDFIREHASWFNANINAYSKRAKRIGICMPIIHTSM